MRAGQQEAQILPHLDRLRLDSFIQPQTLHGKVNIFRRSIVKIAFFCTYLGPVGAFSVVTAPLVCSLLDRPAWDLLALKPGSRLGPYEIIAKSRNWRHGRGFSSARRRP
jgi:hypothetical protein